MDKYGNCDRLELQHLFEGYGLEADQANCLFRSLDTKREGQIQFSAVQAHLAQFLDPEGGAKTTRMSARGSNNNARLSPETMAKICDHIGTKAGQKSRTVRDAFRPIDRDQDKMIDRFEARNFFRFYGSKTTLADKFFDTIDTAGEGKVPMADFQEMFAPFIQPGHHAPKAGECQKSFYRDATQDMHCHTKGAQAYGGFTLNGHDFKPPSRRSSNAGSNASIVTGSSVQNELQRNRFGKFEGVTTYQADFNVDVYEQAAAGQRPAEVGRRLRT